MKKVKNKIKVSELSGVELDWAVAQAEGQEVEFEDGELRLPSSYFKDGDPYKPSEDWAQAGPIIERECISVMFSFDLQTWVASIGELWIPEEGGIHGPTPLIAAMRCYVASKLGEQIDIPKEIK